MSEADCVVALKAKDGGFCLYVEAFFRRNGKSYLKHTTNIDDAKKYARHDALDVVEQVGVYHCTGRVVTLSELLN